MYVYFSEENSMDLRALHAQRFVLTYFALKICTTVKVFYTYIEDLYSGIHITYWKFEINNIVLYKSNSCHDKQNVRSDKELEKTKTS